MHASQVLDTGVRQLGRVKEELKNKRLLKNMFGRGED
jgi:hypothetical protein